MHDRRGIRAERAAGGSIRGLAREFGASRNAVRRAIDPSSSERYRRPSMTDDFEAAVRDVLADDPRLSIARVAELVEWPGAHRTLGDLVERLRPAALEREREDLNRPAVGAMRVGTMTVGRMKVGNGDGSTQADRVQAAHAGDAEVASRAA